MAENKTVICLIVTKTCFSNLDQIEKLILKTEQELVSPKLERGRKYSQSHLKTGT